MTDSSPIPDAGANGTGLPDRSFWVKFAALLLIAIAFLLALTTARNADIWAHLAAGRDVAAGKINDPLSWFGDLVAYLVYSAVGDRGLIFGKCALVAATAMVMLTGATSWRAILTILLALLALGGSLPLSLTCVSYLFLAIAVVAFERRAASPQSTGWLDEVRLHWPLLLCFTLWANVDIWSLLGMVVIGVWAVGRSLVRVAVSEPIDRGTWRLLLLLLLTQVISLMPWHLTAVVQELGNQFTGPETGINPFRFAILSNIAHREAEGLVPVCAFWLLVFVGISSFVMTARSSESVTRRRGWARLAPVLGLFAAAAYHVHFMPFFVLVCGVMSVQNFRSLPRVDMRIPVVTHRWLQSERLRMGVQSLLAVVVTAVLLGVTWAGWFQLLPAERRNWTVEPDPSLVRAAQQVEEWYSGGQLSANQETVFFAEDAEDIFAWFAPNGVTSRQVVERGAVGVARIRAAILTPDRDGVSATLANDRIGCIVLCDSNRSSFATGLRFLTANSNQWVLAHLRGRVAIFARTGTGPAAKPVNLSSRAFDLAFADRADPPPSEAFAIQPRWFDPFVVARPPRSIDREEAVTYLLHEEATRDIRMVKAANRFLAVQVGSLVAAPPVVPAGWVTDPRIAILTTAGEVHLNSEAPPSFPFGRFAAFLILSDVTADHYLAVRAARRGVAASPHDAACYDALGEAYLHLLSDPLELSWSQGTPTLRRLRLAQAAAAFWQALIIEPSRPGPHLGLATIYLERQFFDLAVNEFRAYERTARLQGQQAEEIAKRTQALEEMVEKARRATEANATNLNILDRARLAARNGLTGQALELLLQSDVSAFGAAGIALELDLLVAVGRVREAREWLSPEHRNAIGIGQYDWLGIQSAAAIGNYTGASEILLNQIVNSSKPDAMMSGSELYDAIKITGKETLFQRQNPSRMTIALLLSVINRFADSGRQVALDYQARSNGYLLLALLALEQGDIQASAGYVEKLHTFWNQLEQFAVPLPSVQRSIAQEMESLIHR